MSITLIIIAIVLIGVYIFLQQPQFGELPEGERAQKIRTSPNFQNGSFQNLSITPTFPPGVSVFKVIIHFFFHKSPRNLPDHVLPSIKSNLLSIDSSADALVWFGHSSYYLQLSGRRFLVDPVFSGAASPIKFTTRSLPGSDVYTPGDIPEFDYLIITHDHWDHLDYDTVQKLKSKIRRKIVTGLGTGAHLERWGFDPLLIIEKDWYDSFFLEDGFKVDVTPTRHFSGRTLKRNQALWVSFVLTTPRRKIYVGGDSGYDDHFKATGEKFGPFDLAILECGQYNHYWKYIHMMPEEAVQAAVDLSAQRLLPVHWSKFSLSLHAWDEPIIRVVKESKRRNLPVLHPVIGEIVNLEGNSTSKEWWKT